MKILILFFIFFIPSKSKLTVHFIPHSHCDPGYIKSTAEYFLIVKRIIDRTLSYCSTHPEAKYNWVESSFLSLWLSQASEHDKSVLAEMVKTKQWEIVMGGWTSNDEAVNTYSSSVNQMTLGNMLVQREYGVDVRQGFAIDPFGLSDTQAYLFKEMGFDYHVINRIPNHFKREYKRKKELEFYWYNSVMKEGLFTHVMEKHYNIDHPFNYWDGSLPSVTDANVDDLATKLLKYIKDRADVFLSKNNLFLPYGDDFAYTNPSRIYGNMSKIIDYFNKKYADEMFLKYSTVSEYFDAIKGEKIKFPSKKNQDFYVYNDYNLNFWSGYFASQPRLKLLSRLGEHVMRTTEQLFTFTNIYNKKVFTSDELKKFFNDDVYYLRSKNGEITHHDAVTGTCTWDASDYYFKEMNDSICKGKELSSKLLSSMISKELFTDNHKKSFLLYNNVLEKEIKYGDSVGFFIYNNLGWNREESILRIKFQSQEDKFSVNVTDIDEKIYSAEYVSDGKGGKEVLIKAKDIPAVGYKYFVVHFNEPIASDDRKRRNAKSIQKRNDLLIVSNNFYEISFDKDNKISNIYNLRQGISLDMNFDFYYYESKKEHPVSNAYSFSPRWEFPFRVSESGIVTQIIDNDVVVEVYITYTDYISIVLRLFKGKTSEENNFFEIDFTKLGEIPEDREIVLKIKTDTIHNKQRIYHDELGLEMKEKKFKHNILWELETQENLYPTQYTSYIEDTKNRLSIITSKSSGVISRKNGEVEILLHRRPGSEKQSDFSFLNDKYVITQENNFKIRFIFESLHMLNQSLYSERIYQAYNLNYPCDVFTFIPKYWNLKYPSDFSDLFSFLKVKTLPKEINLLSLDKFDSDSKEVVLRLNNLYENNEQSVEVDLDTLFDKKITSLKEYTLSLLKVKNSTTNTNTFTFGNLEFRSFKKYLSTFKSVEDVISKTFTASSLLNDFIPKTTTAVGNFQFFGKHISTTPPTFLYSMMDYIKKHPVENCFRGYGNKIIVDKVVLYIDKKNGLVDVEEIMMNVEEVDVAVLCTVFKQYLFMLPVPLFTFHLYSSYLQLFKSKDDDNEKIEKIKELINFRWVKDVYKKLSKDVILFLNDFSKCIDITLMGCDEMGVVFSPIFLRQKKIQDADDINDTKIICRGIAKIIRNPKLYL